MEIRGRSAGEQDGDGGYSKRDVGRRFDAERVGQILKRTRERELRIARGFSECRGLSKDQVEELYQWTVLALLKRPYGNEDHLLRALRIGIKRRALNLHRDEHLHDRKLIDNALSLQLAAQEQAARSDPEAAVLAQEDRLIAAEFKTELTEDEKRVFAWLAEGLQYRAIARVLDMPVNEARKAARSCARKSERFELLYRTGRLCGYRSRTIKRLKEGRETSEELAERAFAHLESCAHCRAEHHTNAERLRASFRDQAAALLPPVLVVGHLGWFTRLGVRARMLLHRLGIDTVPAGQGGSSGGGVRERVIALLAGGGASAKIAAAGVVAVGVIAGGAAATHVLERGSAVEHHRHHTAAPSAAAVTIPPTSLIPAPPLRTTSSSARHTSSRRAPATSSRQRRSSERRRHALSGSTRRLAGSSTTGRQFEPGGFAYLGVPRKPSTSSGRARAEATVAAPEDQHGGGTFSP